MTDPVNSMSQQNWANSTDPVERFGWYFIRNGRFWMFNRDAGFYVTVSDEKAAELKKAHDAVSEPAAEEPASEGLTWDNMKWMP